MFEQNQRGEYKKGLKRKEKAKLAKREKERQVEEPDEEEEDESSQDEEEKEEKEKKAKSEEVGSESSDDAPLTDLAKEVDGEKRDGTKRKAEVLSKESGKIGVTITTSPGSSGPGSPPPVKKNKDAPVIPVSFRITFYLCIYLFFKIEIG